MTVLIPINPVTAPSRLDTPNFASRADSYHAWLPSAIDAMNLQNAENNTINSTVAAAVSVVAADKVLAQAAAATVTATNPATNAAAAAASAVAAAASAAAALAATPETPFRLNPQTVTANFIVPVSYNAATVGPITIASGITVTISTNSVWSIH